MTPGAEAPFLMGQRLQGKVAIVTGAAGSIGRDTVRLFAEEGATVFALDRDWRGADAQGHEAIVRLDADVTDEASFAGAVSECAARGGRIDVLFNNAGVEGPSAAIPEYPLRDFRAVLDVNVIGVFLGLKLVLPHMAHQGRGSIINASSVGGLRGSRSMCGYVASKHAVLGLTRTAALEWGSRGVRVNAILPGYVESRMLEEYLERPGALRRDDLMAKVPLGRFGTGENVARLVLFLASDDSGYVTGASYPIDGGAGAG
jgi:NAD(P)-dependent dehydrogenase (short-subunit alcohol dehydrogenase family)